MKLQVLEKERDKLAAQWSRLKLEQGTALNQVRVEQYARWDLEMKIPKASEIKVVREPVAAIEEVAVKESPLDETKLSKLDVKLGEVETLLGMDEGALEERLAKISTKRFHYLGRQIEPEKAQQISELNIPAIRVKREYRRFYPMAETTSHVVGFTNIDDQETVQLSLDHRIQYAAYKLLKGEVYKLNAKSGSVVVLDTVTGEVLAMANMPGFNPNDRKSLKPYHYRNRAVVDSFEPGSTLKPITIAAALEARAIGEDVSIETSPGKFKVGKVTVKDPKNYGSITLSKLLAKSSNVGASKVALLMKSSEHWKFLNRVGFGRKPDAGFFSESEGKLAYYDKWGKVDRVSHGYGYGSVSIKEKAKPLGQQVMSETNADAVLKMMTAVVQADATGKNATVDGYNVAGKTGTAYKLKNGRYSKDHLIPKVEKASGGRLAAPLFSKIMTNALRIMDIAPDDLPQLKQAKPHSPSKSSIPVTSDSPGRSGFVEKEGEA
ncbi:Peptidoglycan D,D-transpeptidase FtsI [Nymphon striatum]|nr:Peptidoglycan D,D-transpeptidase FtsI [Nymphon striatum]